MVSPVYHVEVRHHYTPATSITLYVNYLECKLKLFFLMKQYLAKVSVQYQLLILLFFSLNYLSFFLQNGLIYDGV